MTDATSPSPANAAWPATAGSLVDAHFVQFYESDALLADAVARFFAPALLQGERCLLVATEAHRAIVLERLARLGLGAEAASGALQALDAEGTMALFMVSGWPDASLFHEHVGGMVARAASGRDVRRIRIFGEMVALLWAQGMRKAAVRVEQLWNEVAKRHSISLFCAYPLGAFGEESDDSALLEVCAEHGAALPAESHACLPTDAERARHVLVLQQKALVLEREIKLRRSLEDSLRRRDDEMWALLEDLSDPVVDVDGDGIVRWANAAFSARLGRSRDASLHSPVSAIVATPGLFEEIWRRSCSGEVVRDLPLQVRRRDGSELSYVLRSSVLRMQDSALQMRWFLRAASHADVAA